ncbi:hypothetical protein Tco_1002953 [Tanacetum coccineum]|uniref:Uncharacterized protein n=1 Tax=Tanacetum coccineum TaxID=301880 RepID=A0ABQ5F820_9ASTR
MSFLAIEQYLRLTQESQAPKRIKDMTIVEYTPTHDPILEFAHYFSPNQPGAKSDYDSEDMEEEVEYMTDDEVVMSEQEESNHGITQNTQHLEERKIEMKDDIKKRQFEASTANVSDEVSSIASNKVNKKDDNTLNTAPCRPPNELSPGSFLIPFNIDNHNFYATTTLDLKRYIMPQRVYKYLGLDKLKGPISLSPDKRGLVKRWHICKPIHVTYDDGSGEDYGMWPTCDPDSKFCFGYNEVFGNEYAKEIGNPYSRDFDEYNNVFNNEIEQLSNEYILRIGKKGYVLDDVWEKCQQNYKKTNEAWHDEGYEEDEMWQSGDEKTDYDPPYVNIKTFEVKKYSFKGGRSFICITNREDEALPLGRVNGARFKAMIRKEFKENKIQQLGGNYRDRLDSSSCGNFAKSVAVTV